GEHDGEAVGGGDDAKQGGDERRRDARRRRAELGAQGGDEQEGHQAHPKQHQVGKPPPRVVHGSCCRHPPLLMLPAISKIGRYIEMMSPPTMPPRNTIMSGSMSLVSAATATSTSSS